MENNPLLNWEDLPPFDRIETHHIEPGIRALLEDCEQAVTRLEENSPRTWRELMDPLERIEDDLGRIWGIVSHLHGVKNSPELREVYDPLLAEVVKFGNRLGQSKPLYRAYCDLRDSEEARGFAPAQQRILESAIREAELNGVGLDDADRERYNEISQRLAELSTKFSNNVLDATKAFKIKLSEAEETEGLPETLLELAADTARQEGHEEATAADGPWVLTLDYPSFMPFMQHSKRRDLRERMYRAFISKASDGQWDNRDVAREIIALRNDKCRLLGFGTFAALSLSRKMAPDAGSVRRLLDELRAAGRGAAERDMEALKALAGMDGRAGLDGDDDDELKHWDVPYWAERLREARYDLKDEELRPYFPLPRVLNGLFELTERLFGVRLEEATGEAPVWHEDVQYFRVFDGRGEPMAAFYLDPYSRPAEKQGGAWMDSLVGRSAVMASKGRTARLPVAYMICNQGKPVGGKPSLMTFREVETLFHEFGHALQHMLTTIDYGMASGISNVEWDAVEIASQFMENWCYDRGTLKGLARHFETDEPLARRDRRQAARRQDLPGGQQHAQAGQLRPARHGTARAFRSRGNGDDPGRAAPDRRGDADSSVAGGRPVLLLVLPHFRGRIRRGVLQLQVVGSTQRGRLLGLRGSGAGERSGDAATGQAVPRYHPGPGGQPASHGRLPGFPRKGTDHGRVAPSGRIAP